LVRKRTGGGYFHKRGEGMNEKVGKKVWGVRRSLSSLFPEEKKTQNKKNKNIAGREESLSLGLKKGNRK